MCDHRGVHLTPRFDERPHLEARLDDRIALSDGDEVPPGTRVLVDGRPTDARLDTLGLEGVVIPWSGVWPQVREALAAHPHLRVHNLHHNASLVAEHAVALALAASRQVLVGGRTLRQGDWRVHRARHTRETERLRMEHLATTLNAWVRGHEVPHPVDLERGYSREPTCDETRAFPPPGRSDLGPAARPAPRGVPPEPEGGRRASHHGRRMQSANAMTSQVEVSPTVL